MTDPYTPPGEPQPTIAYTVDESGDYQPRVPDWLRDLAYYAGLAASAAMLIWTEQEILVRIGAAITLIGTGFAKVYRARKNK